MRTHLTHRTCNGGEVSAETRTVQTRPSDAGWPKDTVTRVAWCHRCRAIVSVAECDDERIPK